MHTYRWLPCQERFSLALLSNHSSAALWGLSDTDARAHKTKNKQKHFVCFSGRVFPTVYALDSSVEVKAKSDSHVYFRSTLPLWIKSFVGCAFRLWCKYRMLKCSALLDRHLNAFKQCPINVILNERRWMTTIPGLWQNINNSLMPVKDWV